MKKTVLILIDGMRPDSLAACGHPFVPELTRNSLYTLSAETVMPSVTLPCHMSLFHSVTPQRHGILSNTYVPQVRPVRGLCEVLRAAKKKNAFFYNWEELKDLSRPDSLAYANFISGHVYGYKDCNQRLTDSAIGYINSDAPDFTFLYLGYTDATGHDYGWMSSEYLTAVNESIACVERLIKSIPDEYYVIVTADHGGHDRTHGSELSEDMRIPLFIYNSSLACRALGKASIMDIAPTIASLCSVEGDDEWEGNPLI